MRYCFSLILLTLTSVFCFTTNGYAQENNTTTNSDTPVILYNGKNTK